MRALRRPVRPAPRVRPSPPPVEPPRRRPLTARTIAALKPGPKLRRVPDGKVPWLALCVHPGGRKSWTLGYRVSGRQRVWTMGTSLTLPLAAARKKAQRALQDLADHGIDPAVGKAEARTDPTFGDLAAQYLDRFDGKPSTKTEYTRILDTLILPTWRHRPAKSITRRDVVHLIEAIAEGRHRDDGEPAPVAANRTIAVASAVFNAAVDREVITTVSPVRAIPKVTERSRERVLTDIEIRALWAACEAAKAPRTADDPPPVIAPMIAIGLQALLGTAQRSGEQFTMRWTDLTVEDHGEVWWEIPKTVTKNGREHRVPIGPRVLSLLCEASALGPADAKWVFAGAQGGSVAARAKKAMAALRAAGAIPADVTRHDIRRTVATNLGTLKVHREDIGYVLNHSTGGRGSRVTQTYDKSARDAEKLSALDKWARKLDEILGEAAPGKVVSFAR
jgi:integrase